MEVGARKAEEAITGRSYPEARNCLNCGVVITDKNRPDVKPPLEMFKKCMCVECVHALERA